MTGPKGSSAVPPPEAQVVIEHQLSPGRACGVTGGFLECRVHTLIALLSLKAGRRVPRVLPHEGSEPCFCPLCGQCVCLQAPSTCLGSCQLRAGLPLCVLSRHHCASSDHPDRHPGNQGSKLHFTQLLLWFLEKKPYVTVSLQASLTWGSRLIVILTRTNVHWTFALD